MPGHADDAVTREPRLRPHARRARRQRPSASTRTRCARGDAPWFARGVTLTPVPAGRTRSRRRSTTTRWKAATSCASRRRRRSRAIRSPSRAERERQRHALRAVPLRPATMGHGDRPRRLHRLQRVHDRLPGREQHPDGRQGPGAHGREMHWIRVDRYYEGPPGAPAHALPAGARACNASTRRAKSCARSRRPCTIREGINVQVYNRCVGTRFCSNNCPYKVRRFNFLQYSDEETESLEAQRNPRGDRAHARRHGEVQLLPAAHHERPHRGGQARTGGFAMARSSRRARPRVRRARSSSAISTIRRAPSTRARRRRSITRCSPSSTPSRGRPTSRSSPTRIRT